MAEPMREGTPTQEGWYECEIQGVTSKFIACPWWDGSQWRYGPGRKDSLIEVLRFQGPLVILEPSQGARERLKNAKYTCPHECSETFVCEKCAVAAITAAEQAARVPLLEQIELLKADLHSAADRFQAAYRRGREEGRRENLRLPECCECGVSYVVSENWPNRIRCPKCGVYPAITLVSDQPTHPGEQEPPESAYHRGRKEGRREELEKWELMVAELKRIGKLHKDVQFFSCTNQAARVPLLEQIELLKADLHSAADRFQAAYRRGKEDALEEERIKEYAKGKEDGRREERENTLTWLNARGNIWWSAYKVSQRTTEFDRYQECRNIEELLRKADQPAQPAEPESRKYKPPQGGSGTAEPKIVTGTVSDRLNDLERRVQQLEERK